TFVDDTETPVSAFLKLRDGGPCFLLESAEQGGRLGRHSFLGFSPHLSIRWGGGEPLGDPNPDPLGLPDLALMVCELIVAFDHHKHEVSIIALAFSGEDGIDLAYERAVGLIDSVRERLRGAIPGRGRSRGSGARDGSVEWESNLTREQF